MTEPVDDTSRCPKAAEGFEPYHKWIYTATIVTPKAHVVASVTCGICFHTISLANMFKK